MSRISEHISALEYSCRCCSSFPPSWIGGEPTEAHKRLFTDFEEIRQAWGKPIVINSGYRCIKHNQEVGGEPCSIHIAGLALDLSPFNDERAEDLLNIILKMKPYLRVGYYQKKNFLHIDRAWEISPIFSPHWKMGVRWSE